MGFFTDFSKNSFDMTDKEKTILKYIVSLVDGDLPFPKPARYVIDDVSIRWSPKMMFAIDDCTYGMWTYTHKNCIYVRPEESHFMARRIRENSSLTKKENRMLEAIENRKSWSEAILGNIDADHDTLGFIMYLLEANGHTTTTILHELWHRQQFKSNPVKYMASCAVTNIVSYEWACGKKWSIENDVREKVDNDGLKSKLKEIYSRFHGYAYLLNQSIVRDLSDDDKKRMDGLATDEVVMKLMAFAKKTE